MRLLFALLAAVFAAGLMAQIPPPAPFDGPRALDPLLYDAAKLADAGRPWVKRHIARGGHVDDGRMLFEIAEFGQRTPTDGPWPNEGPTIAARLQKLEARFPSLEWIPSGSSAYQRGWIKPAEVVAFHGEVLKAMPDAVTSRWVPPDPASYGSIDSGGPAVMDADFLHELGTRGSGVKIAVFDIGFDGIDSWAASECGPVSTHPNQPLWYHDNHPAGEYHGTACVEIIRDIAPEASILIIDQSDPQMDVNVAVNYAVNWGADVISQSLGYPGYPGAGAACQAAQSAINAGVHFVNSAGNYADYNYWESGSYTVGGGDFVQFSGTDITNYIYSWTGGEIILWYSYESPSSSYASYQLRLYEYDGFNYNLVDSGNSGSTDQAVYYTAQSNREYYVAIFQTSAGIEGRMRLFSPNMELYYADSYGSISNPATLPAVVSVGAVSTSNYTSSGWPESYSSRGGGIFNLPLTLCAPTDCWTVSYGSTPFNGTSCACPNFAGFLALHISRPEYAANPMAGTAVIDIGPSGQDPDTGHGLSVAYIDGYENDNSPGAATDLGSSTNSSPNHLLAPANDVDWFEFTLNTPGDVALQTNGPSGDTGITLYDSTMAQIGYDDNGGTGDFSRLVVAYLPVGTYYVAVDQPTQNEICEYSLSLSITRGGPSAVGLLSPSNGSVNEPVPVSMSWTATTSTSPATYRLELATDSSFNSVVATRTGIDEESESVGGLQDNTEYWWRVRAENPYGESLWSATKSFTTFESPTQSGGGEGGGDDDDDEGCSTGSGTGPWWALLCIVAGFLALRSASSRDA